MRSGPMYLPRVPVVMVSLMLLFLSLLTGRSLAQATAAGSYGPDPARFELYGGYGFIKPFGSDIGYRPYEFVGAGGVVSASAYLNRTLGLQVEGNLFPKWPRDNNCVFSAQVGPILRRQKGRLVPFVHGLGGAAKVGGPNQQTCSVWGWGVTGGGGVDYILPYLHDRFAVRPIQADFTYSHIDNGVFNGSAGTGGLGEIYALRLSAGVVVRFDGIAHKIHEAVALGCTASPAEIAAGDPVMMTATPTNLLSSNKILYAWSSTGGKVSGTDASETLDSAGLAPGIYNVSVRLLQGSRNRQIAFCMASFAVHALEPPTLSCSADRASINSGEPVVITSLGNSAQKRPLTYTYTASTGQITGNGPTAALSTAGAAPGTINVICNVADDRGQSASATTSVLVATPVPPPPTPQASNLCALSFERDARRPNRVDNEAKGCLDDIALALNRDAGAKLILVGNFASTELQADAAERALNAAQYLIQEKGIDATRLDLKVGSASNRTVTTTIVPVGASSDAALGSSFDAGKIHRSGPAYGRPGAPQPKRAPPTHHPHARNGTAKAMPSDFIRKSPQGL